MRQSKSTKKKTQRLKTEEFEKSIVAEMDEAEILESYGNKSYIHLSEIKKMNYRQLKELALFYELEGDIERFEIVNKRLEKVKEPEIEFASAGVRIWSYYYEKNIFRLSLLAWVLLWSATLKQWLEFKIQWKGYDMFLENIRWYKMREYLADGVPLSIVILILGIIALWLAWRYLTAHLESEKNRVWGHSTLFRRKIRLIIVDERGEFLPVGKLILRGMMKMFPFYLFSLLHMQYHGRGFHDIVMGTYVLKIDGDPDPKKIKEFVRSSLG